MLKEDAALALIDNQRFLERFWSKVRFGECWEWTDCADRNGYGLISIACPGVGLRKVYAHRMSVIISKRSTLGGMYVLHRCDRPACVNPGHLFLGTQGDNVRDMVKKKRNKFGERSYLAKISERDAIAIRSLAGSMTQREIGLRYGISQAQVSRISHGLQWRHLS